MRRAQPLLTAATLTLAVLLAALILLALARSTGTSLTGQLTVQRSTMAETKQVAHYDAVQVANGVSVPSDAHVIFTIPAGVRMPRVILLGGADFDEQFRYWGYCYSGREQSNKRAGKRGRNLYDGQFFYSKAEFLAEHLEGASSSRPLDPLSLTKKAEPQVLRGPRASEAEILYGGRTCYLMSSVILPVSSTDTDHDELNDEREKLIGSDPRNPDTDGDGIADGEEILSTHTSPLLKDTDGDNLPDGCEDKNHNGAVSPDETSALEADTDRDGLCDGDGTGNGCPENRLVTHGESRLCDYNPNAMPRCYQTPRSPVRGEDMNQNCQLDSGETDPKNPETFGLSDWQYKWLQYQKSLKQ